MEPVRDPAVEERLKNIELSIDSLRLAVERLIVHVRGAAEPASAERQAERTVWAPDPEPAPPAQPRSPRPEEARTWVPRADEPREWSAREEDSRAWFGASRQTPRDDLLARLLAWVSARDAQWWLGLLGVGFVVLAVVLLYAYGVERQWITPPVRVAFGIVLGAALFIAGRKLLSNDPADVAAKPGLRELVLGGAIAVWYMCAYAAAAWYGLISVPLARLVFFLLGIGATWVALDEGEELFAVLVLLIGFATPFLLPASPDSVLVVSLYLAGLAAQGLTVYLMRGWLSALWLCFLGFWVSLIAAILPAFAPSEAPAPTSFVVAIVTILGGLAFSRSPSLRRQLRATGNVRYAGSPGEKPDHIVMWFVTVISPILAFLLLPGAYPPAPVELWGGLLALLGLGAALLFTRKPPSDFEIAHVQITGAALWTIIGMTRVVRIPEMMAVCAVIALVFYRLVERDYKGPRVVAKLTAALLLLAVASREINRGSLGPPTVSWAVVDVVVIVIAAFMANSLRDDRETKHEAIAFAVGAYFTTLVVIVSILGAVWTPLVTAGFAALGAGLLIYARRGEDLTLLTRMGALTILIVVVRVLLVDLATVDTIWRVLLFLACGAAFLFTAYRLQPERFRKS